LLGGNSCGGLDDQLVIGVMRPYPSAPAGLHWVTSRDTFAVPYDFVVRSSYPTERAVVILVAAVACDKYVNVRLLQLFVQGRINQGSKIGARTASCAGSGGTGGMKHRNNTGGLEHRINVGVSRRTVTGTASDGGRESWKEAVFSIVVWTRPLLDRMSTRCYRYRALRLHADVLSDRAFARMSNSM
jgi:hypothetical protein